MTVVGAVPVDRARSEGGADVPLRVRVRAITPLGDVHVVVRAVVPFAEKVLVTTVVASEYIRPEHCRVESVVGAVKRVGRARGRARCRLEGWPRRRGKGRRARAAERGGIHGGVVRAEVFVAGLPFGNIDRAVGRVHIEVGGPPVGSQTERRGVRQEPVNVGVHVNVVRVVGAKVVRSTAVVALEGVRAVDVLVRAVVGTGESKVGASGRLHGDVVGAAATAAVTSVRRLHERARERAPAIARVANAISRARRQPPAFGIGVGVGVGCELWLGRWA
mmetsp:Transcript_71403/g.201416  ORF Transcript_71403/g.201416 Transcript_71403/m.201416 type:complete len:276 (+) Transcript_71403:184-1011(+)